MVQHSSIDHTGITGAGGSVATDAIFDAKGDLAVGTGANTAAKLTAGTNGHVLTADSAETTGLKWAAGGASNLESNRVIRTAGDVTTTSTSFVDLTGASITFTTGARRVLLGFVGSWFLSSANTMALDFVIDGTRVGAGSLSMATWNVNHAGNAQPVTPTYLTDVLSAASHTFKVQWRVSTGTGTMQGSADVPYMFYAVELLAD